LESEVAAGLGEAQRSSRALEEARGRAEAAERRADQLRGEVDRLGRDREADREGFDAASQALRRELEEARSREAAGREEAAALSDALDELRRRTDQAAATDRDSVDDDPADRLEDLTRQLAESRRSNQRLCSLLDVFGLPRDLAVGRSAQASDADADVTPSPRPSALPG
jgi:hypothetical protein